MSTIVRVVRFLAEIEHCQSNSKFCTQVCSFDFEILDNVCKKLGFFGSVCRSFLMNKKRIRNLLFVTTMEPAKLNSFQLAFLQIGVVYGH